MKKVYRPKEDGEKGRKKQPGGSGGVKKVYRPKEDGERVGKSNQKGLEA